MKLTQEDIEVVLKNQQPVRFTWRGKTYCVTEVLERWVVDAEWWGRKVSRVYFRLNTTKGVMEIYRQDGSWMLSHVMD